MSTKSTGNNQNIETIAVHAGRNVEKGSHAVTPSITMSTTFERASDGSYPGEHVYSRSSNPNRQALETALGALEGGRAYAFASGLAAATAWFQTLRTGDHILIPDDLYHGTRDLVQDMMGRWGLASDAVDMRNMDAVKAAIRDKTRLLWLETPSNPLLNMVDIAALSELAHEANALVAVDNTWATPVLQRPLELGADVVMHSSTKYIGGHSDVMGGCIVLSEQLADDHHERLYEVQKLGGGIPSPFDCWLLLRSIPTLPHRVRIQSENAQQLAVFLDRHPQVTEVHYPGLENNIGHIIATKQMHGGFGGMLSFEVSGDATQAQQVASSTQIITQATSLGGIESLIEHRTSIEGPKSTTPPTLLRLSVGIEHIDDLITDLDRALLST